MQIIIVSIILLSKVPRAVVGVLLAGVRFSNELYLIKRFSLFKNVPKTFFEH